MGGARYNLSPNGSSWYYWNGTSWGSADGSYTRATAASDLTSAAMTAFATQLGTGHVYFKAFLKSDGTQACEIDDITILGSQ